MTSKSELKRLAFTSPIELADKYHDLEAKIEKAMTLINEQAEDDALWFQAPTASEAYLQQSLRLLTDAVEGVSDE